MVSRREGLKGALAFAASVAAGTYLKYQNRRADYLAAWWNAVNWDKASANFAKAPV